MDAQERNRISVLIVDDHPPTRAGIRAMIENTADIYVVGEAESGDEAQRLLAEFCPRIVLLDLVMPGFSPYNFERWARENYPATITLVLTSHDRDAYLASMIEAGAAGYLDKKSRAEQLMDAIRRAAKGIVCFSDEQIARARKWDGDIIQKWKRLSHREREILQHIVAGESNRKIAESLSITLKTVEFHMTNILGKLDLNSRDQVIVWILKHRPDDPWATEN